MRILFILACVFHIGYQKPQHSKDIGQDYDIIGALAKLTGDLLSNPKVQTATGNIISQVIGNFINGQDYGLHPGQKYVGKLKDLYKGKPIAPVGYKDGRPKRFKRSVTSKSPKSDKLMQWDFHIKKLVQKK